MSRGWELLAICLAFFPPSPKFFSLLEAYIVRHLQDKDSEAVLLMLKSQVCYQFLHVYFCFVFCILNSKIEMLTIY